MPIKIENHFYPNLHTVVLMPSYPFDHMVQKQHPFLYFFILFGTFSGYVFMIFFNFSLFFRCYDLNTCDFPVPMSELHCGRPSWLAPLNFMVEIHLFKPFSTSTMKFTHRNLLITCIQTFLPKNNEKISKSPEIAPNEVEIEKEMLLLNQMVNNIFQRGRFVM